MLLSVLIFTVVTCSTESTTQPGSSSAPVARSGEGDYAEWSRRLEQAKTPLEECIACVALAQSILVRQCAEPLSLRCYGIKDGSPLSARVAEAMKFLDRAGQALKKMPRGKTEGETADARREMETRIELLRDFGGVFAALADDTGHTGSRETLLAACNQLATQLDDENPAVVQSAKLWLGVAYRAAQRPERTVQIIRPLLSDPIDARLDLLTRLQHSLALGDRGDHAAGLAVCLRIGGRAVQWFKEAPPELQQQADVAVIYTRVVLLKGWAGKLRAAGKNREAEAQEADAQKFVGSLGDPPPPGRLLLLEQTIIGLPEWEVQEAGLTSTDAKQNVSTSRAAD